MWTILKSLLASDRFKSFYWRSGGFIAVGFFGLILQNIGLFHLTPLEYTAASLVLNEITKFLNDYLGTANS